MIRRKVLSLALLAIWLGLILLAGCAASKPTCVINAPPSGSQFREGDPVAIQSNSKDSAGVTKVELYVDGMIVASDSTPSPQASFTIIQTWRATLGSHTISVRAYNASGGVSDPAAISVSVLPALGPTPVIPTAIPTAIPITPFVPPTTAPTLPPFPTNTPSGPPCSDNSAFVAHVTVPDDTTIAAGQGFNKIWRLSNNGTCTWGTGYQFVFIGGETMSATTVLPVPATVPGATADFLVPMTAPSTPGAHSGRWQLRNPFGVQFGQAVSVRINVPGACPGAPVISSFNISPTTINAGQATTLSWGQIVYADSATIDQGIGGIATSGGSRAVTPAQTTTYTLTASGCGGSVTRQVNVTVNPVCPVPVISSFIASPTTINAGESTTLSWGLVTGATGVSIDQGIGGVGTPSSTVVSPRTTTTYTMTATGCGGTVTRQVTVNVQQAFTVTSATAAINPSSYSGNCPAPAFNHTAFISTNRAGAVTFRWERSDGQIAGQQTINVTDCRGDRCTGTSTIPWNVDKGNWWARVHVLSPNDLYSNQASFSNSCQTPTPVPPFTVTSLAVTATPTTYTGPCPPKFNITAFISTNRAGTVTYQWTWSTMGLAVNETFNVTDCRGDRCIGTITREWNSAPPSGNQMSATVRTISPTDRSSQVTFINQCK